MAVRDVYRLLDGALVGTMLADEPLSRHTTLKVGGPAALFIRCAAMEDLRLVIEACRRCEVPWTVIGRGSNLVASDSGYPGVVIELEGDFKAYGFAPDGTLTAGAGTQLALLVQEAFNRCLTGLEPAVGIPGTLGGAIVMDAGSRRQWIGSSVLEVKVYDPDAGLRRISGSDIEWGYRRCSLPAGVVVVSAVLGLTPANQAMLRGTMEGSLARRRKSQPLNMPSAGSTFKNPEGANVAELIEGCGLKGLAVGGAQVSTRHANFIVNTGGATAADVIQLALTVRERVREVHGIELQPEVRFLGFSR